MWFPFMRMRCAGGKTPFTWVQNPLVKNATDLLKDWEDQFGPGIKVRRSQSIEHGDLQHRINMVTFEGELRLVD